MKNINSWNDVALFTQTYFSFSVKNPHSFVSHPFFKKITFCRSALTGRLRVSAKCTLLASLGFEDGVCIEKHLIQMAMNMTKAIPISRTAHLKKKIKKSQYDIVITKNIVWLLLKYYLGNSISKLNKILLDGTWKLWKKSVYMVKSIYFLYL